MLASDTKPLLPVGLKFVFEIFVAGWELLQSTILECANIGIEITEDVSPASWKGPYYEKGT